MAIVTKRIGTVREFGDSLGLTLSSELIDLKLDAGDDVTIILEEEPDGRRRVFIEKIEKKK